MPLCIAIYFSHTLGVHEKVRIFLCRYMLFFIQKFINNTNFCLQKSLINKVNEIVKSCSTSLIVFDEIHEMCPSILDAIKPMLDHHHAVDGVDYRYTVINNYILKFNIHAFHNYM